ncbi:MAG: MFS transporter [Candidatus Eremiobacteraeota bacterium]|nr:MFS transporter [Candidatus Eremiobacteraeota bacterium]
MQRQNFRAFDFLNISIFWFAISFHWGAILGIFLQKEVLLFAPNELKGYYYGILAGSGALASGLVQIIIGHISDEFKSKWGRRKPFIFWGVLINTFALILMGLSRNFVTLIFSFMAVQIFANIANGPYQALIPDLVREKQQGKASAWMSLFMFTGQAAGPLFAGFLMARAGGSVDLMVFIAVLMNLFMLYTVVFVREPSSIFRKSPGAGNGGIKEMFTFSLKKYPDYTWILISRGLVNMGFYTALGFLMYYLKESIGVIKYEMMTGILIMSVTVAGIFSAYPAGILADIYSKKKLLYISGGLMALTAISLAFATDIKMVLVCGAILGIGFGAFSTVDWALVCNHVPGLKAGKYMGLWNLAFTIPQILAPLIAGYPTDLINKKLGPGMGYRVAMILVVVYLILGLIAIRQVREKKK